MYPLSFKEFLEAIGEEQLAEYVDHPKSDKLVTFRDKYVASLKKYYFIGGMPEVVMTYLQDRDYDEVREVQNTILQLYESDFSKHIESKTELERTRMVWNSVSSSYKLFMVDVGLLGAMAELDAESLLEGNRIFVEFKGAMAEQYVHQQLVSNTAYVPYYYSNVKSRNEIDFLIQIKGAVIPIEVKAEENPQSKSLKAYVDKFKPEYAIRTSMKDYREQDWLINMPLWCVSGLSE